MKSPIRIQLIFILSMIALVFLFSDSSMAGENQWVGRDQKGSQVSAIAIDPVNTSNLYIGTQRGALKSTDGGKNWTPINKGLNNIDVLTLVIDPVDPRKLYAGTRSGAFKSINGGDNWTLMKSCLYEVAVLAIAIDPTKTSTLYAIAQDAAWIMAVFMNDRNESKLKSKFRDCAFKSTNGGEIQNCI